MNRAHLSFRVALIGLLLAVPGCGKKPAEPGQADSSGQAAPGEPAAVIREVSASLGQELLDAASAKRDVSAQLAAHSAELDRLVESTRAPACDFGVDWSSGLSAELPHLKQTRSLAAVLTADAARLLEQGDGDAAAKRVAAALRLSEYTARNAQSIIELLSSAASASSTANFIADHPKLRDAAWKTDIQQAIQLVQRDGTLNSAAIIRRDGTLMATEIRRGRGPDLSKAGGRNWARGAKPDLKAAAQQLDALTASAVAAWNAGDTSTLASLNDRSARGDAAELLPALGKSYESVARLRAALSRASAVLR